MIRAQSSRRTKLVTGAAGLIGSCVTRALAAEGHYVVAVDLQPRHAFERRLSDVNRATIRYCEGDYVDLAARLPLIGEVDLFHLAANTDNRSLTAGRLSDLERTVVPTVHLLDEIEKQFTGQLATVILASSQLVYSGGHGVSETSPVEATSYFAAGKLATEHFVSAMSHDLNFRVGVCRLANIVGPGMGRGLIHEVVKQAWCHGRVALRGSGREIRSFLSSNDCASAMLHVGKHLETHDESTLVNVTNSDSVNMKRLVALVLEQSSGSFETSWASSNWEEHTESLVPDSKRLTRLGWKATAGSEEAISIAAEWLWKNADEHFTGKE